jgi:RNA polymerase sigma-70 factor (ECF subfamily)
MTDEWLAEQFEENRDHLRASAYKMLGSLSEADDAVQETWLRLSRSDATLIQNLRGWLTTVVARVCLDMLRSRNSRREDSLDETTVTEGATPEREAQLADSVGLALLVVLDRLTPAERIAFVLHDMFDVSFDEIGPIVERSPTAARQLASRARRRVRGLDTVPDADLTGQRKVVDAFLTALRAGDFEGLVSVLDPNIMVRIEGPEGVREVRGAEAWARGAITFSRQARFVQPALIDGTVGLVLAPRGRLLRALRFRIVDGKIAAGEIISDPERLRQLDLGVLSD